MVKVTMLEQTTGGAPNPDGTESAADERSISTALAEGVVIIDSKNRRLKLKRPNILQESRLIRGIGEAAENPTYLNAYALPAAMVVEIDGEIVIFPTSGLLLEAAISRLGREGLGAVIQYITSAPKETVQETAAIKN